MVNAKAHVGSKLGLHARAAANLALRATQYKAKIEIERVGSGTRVDAKSIMGVMMLAAGEGACVEVYANGEDEDRALEEICQIIEYKGVAPVAFSSAAKKD